MDRFVKKLSKEEYEAQQSVKAKKYAEDAPARAASRQLRLEKEKEDKAEKMEMKKYLNKKRQERWRASEKEKKARLEEKKIDAPSESLESDSEPCSLPIMIPDKDRRPEWYNPLYWNDIVIALKKWNFVSRKAVQYLQDRYQDGRFDKLSHSTIEGWFIRTVDDSGKSSIVWKERILKRVTERKPMFVPGSGRHAILDSHPEIGLKILGILKASRSCGATMNSSIARCLIIGVLRVDIPQVLHENGGGFKVCRRWVRGYVSQHLGWAFRAITTAAQKLPDDWEAQGEILILRLAYYVKTYDIPKSRVINPDQTGVVILPSGRERTYDIKGSKDVASVGAEEKRAETVVVCSSADNIMPFQCVMKGKTVRSLPSVETRSRAESEGIRFTTNPKNHWSNLKTTKEHIELIVKPWIAKTVEDEKKEEDSIWKDVDAPDPFAVLLLDCWKIHKSKEFLDWVKKRYPKYLVLFIPAGCTGKLQPQDIVLQRVFKHLIRKFFNEHFAGLVVEYLSDKNNKIEDFKLDTKLPTLRNKMAGFVADAYEEMKNRPELVQKAWKLAKAKGLCLLDAWNRPVQDRALRLMASGELFPNKPALLGEEVLVDVGISDDADEVPSDTLIAQLLQADWDNGDILDKGLEDLDQE